MNGACRIEANRAAIWRIKLTLALFAMHWEKRRRAAAVQDAPRVQ